jgi:D-3-phosphoglycerate dehydrogenase
MVADQIKDYLENGNIVNSVNFPEMKMPRAGNARITIANSNVPNMVGQVTSILAEAEINILDMMNKSRGDIAYNLLDIEGDITDEIVEHIRAVEGVLSVRVV